MPKTINKNTGVLYLAFGYEYIIQAINSTKSVKNIHPELSVSIITNVDINNNHSEDSQKLFDNIIYIDDDNNNNRLYKTNLVKYTPYKKTLFLDCDTEIRKPIKDGFAYLDYFDMAMPSYITYPYHMANWWEGDLDVDNIELINSPYFSSGVIFFDKHKSENFFKTWSCKYDSLGYSKDQFSLLKTIYELDTKILPLDLTWEVSDTALRYTSGRWNKSLTKEGKICHFSQPRVKKIRSIEYDIYRNNEPISVVVTKKERKEFIKKYNRWNAIKSRLKRSILMNIVDPIR